MRIQQTRKLPAKLLSYFSDGSHLRTLLAYDNVIELSKFDPHTFNLVTRQLLHYAPSLFVSPCVSQNHIHLPTVEGRLVGLDKASGNPVSSIDLGSMTIVADPVSIDDSIYSLCGVPISAFTKTETSPFCLCVNDKSTGKKRFQSRSMTGRISPISVENKAWVSIGKKLYRYSKQCELEKSTSLNFDANYAPLVTNDFVMTFSQNGSVEVFDHDLRCKTRLISGRNSSAPILTEQGIMWFNRRSVVKLDLENMKIRHIANLGHDAVSSPALHQNGMIVAGKDRVINLDLNGVVSELSVTADLRKPVVIQNQAFVASDDEIFQICLNA